MVATTSLTPASLISTTPTAPPSAAKRMAPERPIPDAAAVTSPTLFANLMSLSLCCVVTLVRHRRSSTDLRLAPSPTPHTSGQHGREPVDDAEIIIFLYISILN